MPKYGFQFDCEDCVNGLCHLHKYGRSGGYGYSYIADQRVRMPLNRNNWTKPLIFKLTKEHESEEQTLKVEHPCLITESEITTPDTSPLILLATLEHKISKSVATYSSLSGKSPPSMPTFQVNQLMHVKAKAIGNEKDNIIVQVRFKVVEVI